MEKLTGLQEADLLDVQQSIDRANEYDSFPTRLLSDGYHSFDELYKFRKVYNAILFNEWGKQESANPRWSADETGNEPTHLPKYDVHKSWRHNNGELCFGGGWFVVVAILPKGQITNHYKAEDWELFKIPSVEKAKYEFDGHDATDTLKRLKNII